MHCSREDAGPCGVDGRQFEECMGLSDPVATAVDAAVSMIETIIAEEFSRSASHA